MIYLALILAYLLTLCLLLGFIFISVFIPVYCFYLIFTITTQIRLRANRIHRHPIILHANISGLINVVYGILLFYAESFFVFLNTKLDGNLATIVAILQSYWVPMIAVMLVLLGLSSIFAAIKLEHMTNTRTRKTLYRHYFKSL